MQYQGVLLRGFSFNGLYRVLNVGLSLVKLVILARLLSEGDFGLFSLTLIALGVSEAATETGINTTMLRSNYSVSYFLDTAWVIAIIRGFVIGSLMLLLGIFLSQIYAQPELLFLIAVSSSIPVIKGFINPAVISFHKQLHFVRDSLYRLAPRVMEVLVAVGVALLSPTAYAMVLGLVAAALFEVCLSFLMLKERPRFAFNRSRAESIFEHSRALNLSALFDYLNENVDNLLIGYLTGTANLGFYQAGYSMSHKLKELSQSGQHATLPVLIKLKGQRLQFRRTAWRSLLLSGALLLLLASPLLVFPAFFVQLLLGNGWEAVVPLIRPLVLAALLQSLTILINASLVARDRFHWMNRQLIATVLLLVGGVWVLGSQYGLLGAVWAVCLSRALTFPLGLYHLRKAWYER